jgi:RNA polymerase sigma-70 factor (ECF subfamily)
MHAVHTRASAYDETPAASWTSDDTLLLDLSNPGAITDFYRRTRDPLLRWLFRQTFDAEAAADILGEVFAVVLERRDRFDPRKGTARAWLWGIAANELKRWRRTGATAQRARRRLGIEVFDVDDESIAHVESLVDSTAMTALVREQLDRLPKSERRALELRVLEHLPYEEVAEQLGCRPGAARVRVSRGLGRLRESLTPVWEPWR